MFFLVIFKYLNEDFFKFLEMSLENGQALLQQLLHIHDNVYFSTKAEKAEKMADLIRSVEAALEGLESGAPSSFFVLSLPFPPHSLSVIRKVTESRTCSDSRKSSEL